ncbi:hypothetical protein BZG36_01178 [Bifiguratus adelaidae]|uniref:FK506-binding protein n=1 Tax=Bifiguratus adelaidae TaxID=1938954 RepID=A0A261Y5I6_9FUNG|nr:hypothetical protein BZG36_01178 [Bifiguratus adelaidae]
MILGFWGLHVETGKTYAQIVDASFRLSMAALDPHPDSHGKRTTLYVNVDGKDFVLCNLIPGVIEQQTLDVVFSEGEEVTFSVKGPNSVHLTGNYLAEDIEEPEDDDMSLPSLDEDEEDDIEEALKHPERLSKEKLQLLMNTLANERGVAPIALADADMGDEDDDNDDEDDDDDYEYKGSDEENWKSGSSDADDDDEDEEMQNESEAEAEAESDEADDEAPSGHVAMNGSEVPSKSKQPAASPEKKNDATKPQVAGLDIKDVKVGKGPKAKSGDSVKVHYVGRFTNGRIFDKSGNKPFSFKLGQGNVIKGWDLGVVGMQEGGERHLIVPPQLAYGSKGAGKIQPNSTLEFDITLVKLN